MAFMDDPEFIIAHIRHSCVITDDTGEQFCKIIWDVQVVTSWLYMYSFNVQIK